MAIVFDLPEKVCQERNRAAARPATSARTSSASSRSQLRRSPARPEARGLPPRLRPEIAEEVEAAAIEREPLWNNKRDEHGPFDIIGDVHGCCDELVALLGKLGYEPVSDERRPAVDRVDPPPEGRKVVFLGDLVDRGPTIPDVLRLVMDMVGRARRSACRATTT